MNGFKLVKKEMIEELKSTGWLYQHQKTGAQVLFMDNKEKEKVFSIAFHTPPKDDTGVAHIAEHSVLCGSKKYPVKEPFVELMKGSVNTFLNAMTYTDWTVYPVASKNDKDFRNLTDVYLDAVFFPLMKENVYTLKQEGWHYEYDKKKKELSINGIVYNEMKGYFSSPDAVGWTSLYGSLYPDVNYRFESGGIPESIPDLTQKKFIDFHDKYYHPSNSYTLVSGDLEIEEFLDYIDREYFSKFEKREIAKNIPIQPSFDKVKKVFAEYSVGEDEPTEGKTFFYYGVSYETVKDTDLGFSMEILKSILVDFPASPLKRALVDAKVVSDLSATLEDTIYQPNITFIGSGGDKKDVDKFQKILTETLIKLAKDGFDQKLVKAAINRIEFKLRELDFNKTPRGIVYHIMNLPNWINENDAFKGLFFEKRLKEIKDDVSNRHFEKIIEKYLVNNKHAVFLTLVPTPGLEVKRNVAFKEQMKKKLKQLSQNELNEIVSEASVLRKLQREIDSPESLSTIPLLKQGDLEHENEIVPRSIVEGEGVTTLVHPLTTNGISYFQFNFNASVVGREDIPYFGLLSEILGQISTEKYNYKELSNIIYSETGGISIHSTVMSKDFSIDKYRPFLVLSGKVLTEDQDKLFSLMEEITLHSKFNDKVRLRELVLKIKSNLESNLASNGMDYALSSAASGLGGGMAYDELLDGASFFEFITKLNQNFDQRFADLSKKLEMISKKIFVRQDIVAGMATDENVIGKSKKAMDRFLNRYDFKKEIIMPPSFEYKPKKEGIVVGGKVQYVVKAVDGYKLGLKEYRGELQVLEKILNASYLWNKIRVLGGAYGGFFRLSSNGFLYFGSYRDPNLAESLQIYDETSQYLKELDLDRRELNKNIIGAIGKFDVPSSPKGKLNFSMSNYLAGITPEFRQKLRNEVFATDMKKLKAYRSFFERVAAFKNYTVAGSEQKIKENKKLFDSIIKFWN